MFTKVADLEIYQNDDRSSSVRIFVNNSCPWLWESALAGPPSTFATTAAPPKKTASASAESNQPRKMSTTIFLYALHKVEVVVYPLLKMSQTQTQTIPQTIPSRLSRINGDNLFDNIIFDCFNGWSEWMVKRSWWWPSAEEVERLVHFTTLLSDHSISERTHFRLVVVFLALPWIETCSSIFPVHSNQ